MNPHFTFVHKNLGGAIINANGGQIFADKSFLTVSFDQTGFTRALIAHQDDPESQGFIETGFGSQFGRSHTSPRRFGTLEFLLTSRHFHTTATK